MQGIGRTIFLRQGFTDGIAFADLSEYWPINHFQDESTDIHTNNTHPKHLLFQSSLGMRRCSMCMAYVYRVNATLLVS